jgi:hypothetical protein
MTEEYLYQRERDFLDYFRNNLEDPENRGTTVEKTFIATAGQTEFTLPHNFVKNVADSLTVNSILKYKGYDYTVSYGEGSFYTKVIFESALLLNDEVKITYHYGSSMVEREFSRTDVKLPRVILIFLTGSAVEGSLGDHFESGKGTYLPAAIQIEVRDKYANRAREIASKAFNLGLKMRHANLFRTNIVNSVDLQNLDYDIEKECYMWIFTTTVEWEIIFS